MSNVKIKGNASGTGNLTIEAPNTNTDRTLTLPDAAGELLTTTGDGSALTGIPTPRYRDQVNWEDAATSQSLPNNSSTVTVIGSVTFTIPTVSGISNWIVEADGSWTGAQGGSRLWSGISLDSTSQTRCTTGTCSSGYTESGWYEGDLSLTSFAVMQHGGWKGVSSGSHTVYIIAWVSTSGYTCWRRGINVRWSPQA